MPDKERYALLKAKGQCPQCSQATENDRVYCDACAAKNRDRTPREGLCMDCGAQVVFGATKRAARCLECRKKRNNAYQRTYHENLTPEAKAERLRKAAEAVRRSRAQDPAKHLEKALIRRYGMTLAEFSALLKEQGGRCAICRIGLPEVETDTRKRAQIAVDHCHVSGKVRGLLCGKCNMALGLLGECVETFQNAITYLERAPFFRVSNGRG